MANVSVIFQIESIGMLFISFSSSVSIADVKSLCDFLAESELQQYYNAIR